MSFDFAQAIKTRPRGDLTAQLLEAYGNPKGPGCIERGGGVFEPSPAWIRDHIVDIQVEDLPGFPPYPGKTVTRIRVHRRIEGVVRATFDELERRGLSGKLRTFDGALHGRHMGHDVRRPLSTHAFGIALDFDAQWNGYGVPLSRMEINREVVRCFEECGWHWGGRWTDPYEDGMHVQWTDPLERVAVPEWQDALAGGRPVAAPPPSKPVFLIPDGQGGWMNIAGQKTEGLHLRVINATDPQRIWGR